MILHFPYFGFEVVSVIKSSLLCNTHLQKLCKHDIGLSLQVFAWVTSLEGVRCSADHLERPLCCVSRVLLVEDARQLQLHGEVS